MAATNSKLFCWGFRTSGKPLGEGWFERPFQRTLVSLFKDEILDTDSFWCKSFDSAEDLLEWIRSYEEDIILRPFDGENLGHLFKILDDLPIPTWEIEIYDDYRE